MNLKRNLYLILMFQLYLFTLLQPTNIIDLKGTYTILKPEYQHLSPAHGAIWWETGLVRKYYEFGNIEEKIEEKTGNQIRLKAENLDLGIELVGEDTIKLIHELFHVVQGSFSVSNNASYPAYHFSAQTIGKIVGTIEKLKDKDAKTLQKDLEIAIRLDDDFKKSLGKTAQEQERLEKEIENFKTRKKESEKALNEVIKILGQASKLLKSGDIELKDEKLTSYSKGLEELTKKLGEQKKEEKGEVEQAEKKQLHALNRILGELKKSFTPTRFAALKKKSELSDAEKDEFKKLSEISEQIKTKEAEIKVLTKKIKTREEEALRFHKVSDLKEQLLSISKDEGLSRKYAQLETIEDQLNSLKKRLADHHAGKVEARLPLFTASLVGSLVECGFISGGEQVHLPYTTHALLLAFLHRKSDGKNELQSYFQVLNKELENKVYDEKSLDAAWLSDRYDENSSHEKILEEIKQKVEVDRALNPLTLPYEPMIFAELMVQYFLGALPNIAEYKTTELASPPFPQKSFPDCMDTTLRNVSNIICYDNQAKIFSYEHKNLKNKKIDPSDKLKKFYRDYTSPSKISNLDVHKAWTEVIENIDFVAYAKAVSKNDDTDLGYVGSEYGYIREFKLPEGLPEESKIQVTSHDNYKLVVFNEKIHRFIDPDKYVGYELIPSLKNVIIALDNIFNLKLFEKDEKGENLDLKKEFFRPNFNELYFPKLCDKFGWHHQEDIKTLDARDYSSSSNMEITLTLPTEEKFTLNLSRGHGYVTVTKKSTEGSYQESLSNTLINQVKVAQEKKAVSIDVKQIFALTNLMSLYQKIVRSSEDLSAFLLPGLKSRTFFLQDLLNENIRLDLLQTILEQKEYILAAKIIKSMPIQQDLHYQNRIIEIIKGTNTADISIIKTAIDFVINKVENLPISIAKLALMKKIVTSGLHNDLKKTIQSAQEGIYSNVYNVNESALDLFKTLFAINKGFKEAIEAAQKAIPHDNYNIRDAALKLFYELFQHDKGFEEAIYIAQERISDNHYGISSSALNLFNELFKKNKGIKEAIETAKKDFKERKILLIERLGVKKISDLKALDLFKSLFEKNKGFEDALEIIQKEVDEINNNNEELRYKLYNLFTLLIKHAITYIRPLAKVDKKNIKKIIQ